MVTRKDQLQSFCVEELKKEPKGLRYSELERRCTARFPEMTAGIIATALWELPRSRPKEVYKPERGLYRLVFFPEPGEQRASEPSEPTGEARVYKHFAHWLVHEYEECTKAIVVGGNRFRGKWWTPDVVGVYRAFDTDIYKPPTEFVSAEIKGDAADLVVAFGQACAYKLYSHKSFIVIPEVLAEGDDFSRIEALCTEFGIGLVVFREEGGSFHFTPRLAARRGEPDPFWVNEILRELEAELLR